MTFKKPKSMKRRPVLIIGEPGQPYYEKVLALDPEQKPGVHHVIVSHDSWCARLKSEDAICNCNPEVKRAAWDGSRIVPLQ